MVSPVRIRVPPLKKVLQIAGKKDPGTAAGTLCQQHVNSPLREHLPTFIDVSRAHILDDAQGDRGWLENASPSVIAVEELPLGP